VWADNDAPSTAGDIKSIVTDTAWYDPAAGGNCSISGMTMSGSSDFLEGSPISLHFPIVTNDAKFAAAMEDFIKEAEPTSPWLEITDLGLKLVQEGRLRDINPMMIVSIGRQETQIG